MPMVEHGHKLKIELSPEAIGTMVYLDGVLVKELVCVEVRHHAGEVSRIKLELLPSAVEILGEVGEVERVDCSPEDARRVRVDKFARELLQGLKNDATTEGQ